MRRNLIVYLFMLFLILSSCTSKSTNKNIVQFEPLNPKRGEKLTVSFSPKENSILANSDNIMMQALFVPATPTEREILENGKMYEIPMKKNGDVWKAELMPDKSGGAIIFQFQSEDKYENNNKMGWDVLLYTNDDKPVIGAYAALAQTIGSGMVSFLMNLKRYNDEKALELYKKELELYPENQRAKVVNVFLQKRKAKDDKKIISKIEEELDSYIAKNSNDVGILELAYSYYSKFNPEKSNAVLAQIKNIMPNHRYVLGKEITEIKKIKNAKKRLEKLFLMEKKVENSAFYKTWATLMLKELSASKKWDLLVKVAEKMIIRINSGEAIYPSFTKKKAEHTINSRLYNPLTFLAKAYYNLGKYTKAESCYNKLSKLDLFPKQEEVFKRNYMQFLVDTHKWDKAISSGREYIEKANYDDKIVELFKIAYTKKTGNKKAAEKIIIEAKKKAGTFRKEEIENMFMKNAKYAPEFSLKNLQGKEISLTSLKGKIVIVDFWATWCGPCKASFPLLQKFWEQHKNDPDVMVIAINTQEQYKGKKRVDVLKKYMTDGKYNFPVLIDENNKVVKSFEVTGLPTKYFIGPDGKIYFKEVGFSGDGMKKDMNIMLDVIRKNVKTVK